MATPDRIRKLLKSTFPLWIKGKRWTVGFAHIAPYPDGQECGGLCNPWRKRIWIDPEQSLKEIRSSLDHEIVHARNWRLSEKAVQETEDLLAVGRGRLNALLR